MREHLHVIQKKIKLYLHYQIFQIYIPKHLNINLLSKTKYHLQGNENTWDAGLSTPPSFIFCQTKYHLLGNKNIWDAVLSALSTGK